MRKKASRDESDNIPKESRKEKKSGSVPIAGTSGRETVPVADGPKKNPSSKISKTPLLSSLPDNQNPPKGKTTKTDKKKKDSLALDGLDRTDKKATDEKKTERKSISDNNNAITNITTVGNNNNSNNNTVIKNSGVSDGDISTGSSQSLKKESRSAGSNGSNGMPNTVAVSNGLSGLNIPAVPEGTNSVSSEVNKGQVPIAVELAKKQKEISVAEFFERNRQLLGFGTPTRALITAVKEAVDNSLDACEEAGILPEITVEIKEYEKGFFSLVVEDNGPGIVKEQIPHVFGRLLYGSRFHAIRQSRGQQGIGISAVVMYAQLTTGRPTIIKTKIGPFEPAIEMEILLDTRQNRAEVRREEIMLWNEKPHGTRISTILAAKYIKGKQTVFDYLKSTAIVNPHARITFTEPDGTTTVFERATERLPKETKEIKPHPQGVELGTLLKMAKSTEYYRITSFLINEFTRVSQRTAYKICEAAYIDPELRPQDLTRDQASRLIEAFSNVKIMAPPTECLSPIGETLIKKGMKKEMQADFTITASRPPSVYSGHPFQIEAGLVYGGELPKDEPIQIMRFANRVPLLYQQGACVITKAIENIDWRRYGLEQKGGRGIPFGPAIVLVHVASTKVPFTSEAKEAIADVTEIENEIELCLRECARKLGAHVKRKAVLHKIREKEQMIRKIIPEIAKKTASILNKPVPATDTVVAKIMNSVMLSDEISYNPEKKQHTVNLILTNYTPSGKTFRLYAVLPIDVRLYAIDPAPLSYEHNIIVWNAGRVPPMETRRFTYILADTEKDDYDETEVYQEGVEEELFNGALPWNSVVLEERITSSGSKKTPEGDKSEMPESEPRTVREEGYSKLQDELKEKVETGYAGASPPSAAQPSVPPSVPQVIITNNNAPALSGSGAKESSDDEEKKIDFDEAELAEDAGDGTIQDSEEDLKSSSKKGKSTKSSSLDSFM